MAEKQLNPWLRIFPPFAVGYFLSYLLRNVNAVVSPGLQGELGLTASDLGLLTAAYMLAFASIQLPLGILLDRYGPRRVEAALLLLAAAGCAIFGLGGNIGELAIGRALIGFGASACLMASFKAFTLWFPPAQLPSLNSAIMAAGGLGALTATLPMSWLLPLVGRSGVFFLLAGLALLVAAAIFATPEKSVAIQGESVKEQWRGLTGILRSRVFWIFAPLTASNVGGFMAMQGLWAVPWMTTVNGFTRQGAAFHLLLSGCALMAGYLLIALFVTRLARRGITPMKLFTLGMGASLLITLLIALDLGATHALWFATGLAFSVSNIAYAQLATHFPPQMSGRVNTALNLSAFVGGFAIQWGFGVLLDLFGHQGINARDAFRLTMGITWLIQAATFAWFYIGTRTKRSN